jgi:predicted nucleotidyltransferase
VKKKIEKIYEKKPDRACLQRIFRKFDKIQAVYLFGSQATNRTHFESDLDLAIYPGSNELKSKKLLILSELARHGFDNVDLIFLDGVNYINL